MSTLISFLVIEDKKDSMAGYHTSALKLWAIFTIKESGIETDVKIDVIRFTARFPINDHPSASLVLAVGRKVNDLTSSPVHQHLDTLGTKTKVKVYFRAKNMARSARLGIKDWANKRILIFEGSTTGAGYRRTSSGAEFVIELESWTKDLAYASSISALSSPQNPNDLIFNALVTNPANTELGQQSTGGFTGLSTASNHITIQSLEEDFWGQGLQPWLIELAGRDEITFTQVPLALGIDPANLQGNLEAVTALRRFEPFPTLDQGYDCGKPLKFNVTDYGGQLGLVAQQIVSSVGQNTLDTLASQTIWDKLIEFSATYLFAIIPLVDRAVIVPFIPGLRSRFKTIFGDEYDHIDLRGAMPRVLRGVGIYGNHTFNTGIQLTQVLNQNQPAPPGSGFGIGGYFHGANNGMVLFRQAPNWMTDLPFQLVSNGTSINLHGNALQPGEGNIPTQLNFEDQMVDNSSLMNKYARALYVYEVLKFRSGTLNGRLRFDIAPGSVIKIEGVGEQFLGISDRLGQRLWATVLQTDIMIDAENSQASTSFHLAHLRNQTENESDETSIDKHPLWSENWNGCELIKNTFI